MAKEKNELKCGRLIDADALIEKYTVVIRKAAGEKLKTEIAVLLKDIEEQPTIEAMPIIRCRDCKHYNATPINMGYCLGVWGLYVDGNGYCYKAEP